MAEKELGGRPGIAGFLSSEKGGRHKSLYVGAVLKHLIKVQDLPVLAADQIRKELAIHFSQSQQHMNIGMLRVDDFDYEAQGADMQSNDVKCVTHTFMEKLTTSR